MTIERWTYTGQVETSDNKLSHCYYVEDDYDGRRLLFGKLKAHVIGGIYEVDVTRNDDGSMSAKRDVTWTGDRATEVRCHKWQAAERALTTERALKSREKKGKDEALQSSLDKLRQAYRTAPGAQRAALLGFIIKEITK